MRIADYLGKDDIVHFTSKSDLRAWGLVLWNWGSIFAVFALMGLYPNLFTILLGLVLLGGRQLGLSVLMHEAGHRTLYNTAKLNDVVGQWLCALPVMNDLFSYAKGHLAHHKLAGTVEDPDLPNYRAYPIDKESFRRKVSRDLSGRTGVKLLSYILGGTAGVMGRGKRANNKVVHQQLLVQALLFVGLSLAGIPWAYLVWVGAYLTTFMLFIRIRQVAEHGAVPDLYDTDPRLNTRTVDAPWWQRLVLAPNGVNYHMEHHFMASVPCYRLRALRDFLRDKGAYDDMTVYLGYGEVIRHVVRA